MHCRTFCRSLIFAALAAALYLPVAVFVPMILGWKLTMFGYVAFVTGAYVAGIAPTLSRGVRLGALASILVLVGSLWVRGPWSLFVAATIAIAVCRAGFLYTSKPGRALLAEVVIGTGALWLAEHLLTSVGAGVALALWGFFLVQSCYFLIGAIQPRVQKPDIDPFEAAHQRALAILEEVPIGNH